MELHSILDRPRAGRRRAGAAQKPDVTRSFTSITHITAHLKRHRGVLVLFRNCVTCQHFRRRTKSRVQRQAGERELCSSSRVIVGGWLSEVFYVPVSFFLPKSKKDCSKVSAFESDVPSAPANGVDALVSTRHV